MNSAILLLGTNVGDKRKNLQNACDSLKKRVDEIQKCSSIYKTEPWGFKDEQWFYNCALILQTHLLPDELIKDVLEIEKIMGRERNHSGVYENRIIDIDILFFNSEIIKTKELELPHPRLHLRKFALLPLAEIAPDFVHPVILKNMKEILEECKDECKVVNIGNL